jgi:hypothetical protein
VAVGPALLGSTGGIAPLVSAAVIGQAQITRQAGVELMALFPLGPVRWSNMNGSSQISVALFAAAGSWHLQLPGPWIADASLGISAVMFRAVGDPSTTVNAGTDVTWVLGAQARLGGGLAITRWLAVRVDVIGGATARRIVLAYNLPDGMGHSTSQEVAAWGHAFAAGTASLQASW